MTSSYWSYGKSEQGGVDYNKWTYGIPISPYEVITFTSSATVTSSATSTLSTGGIVEFTGSLTNTSSLPTTLLSRTMGLIGSLSTTSNVPDSRISLTIPLISTPLTVSSSAQAEISLEIIITGLIGGAASLTATPHFIYSLISTISSQSTVTSGINILYLVSSYPEESDHIHLVWSEG